MNALPEGSWRTWTDSSGDPYYVMFVPGDEVLPLDTRVRMVKRDGRVKISRTGTCVAQVPGGRLYHPSRGLAGGGARRAPRSR